MKRTKFKKLVKEKCIGAAFEYLSEKQSGGKNGKHIRYSCLTMAEYLRPESDFSLEDQREVFAIRCRTNPLPANRGILEYCIKQCGEVQNNSHS